LTRPLIGAALALAMLVFGFGVYHAAGLLKVDHSMVNRPNEITAPALPGTVYLAQRGALYRFRNGSFTQITPEGGWMQPAVSPDGRQLVAVQRKTNYSDLFVLTATGRPTSQITHNNTSALPEYNHWVFYPRFSSDGSTLFYDYDHKDGYSSYQVDLAIFATPTASWRSSVQWSIPHPYTGGDVSPAPIQGGIVFTKFWIDDQSMVHSQVWLQARPRSQGVPLTPKDVNCVQPAVSADQKSIAMICTRGQTQSTELNVASYDATTATLGIPTTLVKAELIASPAFSPDGKSIAYLAPVTPGGAFQLWTVGVSGNPAPRAFTTTLGLDSSSSPVWVAN